MRECRMTYHYIAKISGNNVVALEIYYQGHTL